MVFELFVELNATDEQLDFPVIYASAKNGYAMRELAREQRRHGAALRGDRQAHPAAAMRPSRIFRCSSPTSTTAITSAVSPSGASSAGASRSAIPIVCIHRDGRRERANVTAIFHLEGLEQIEIQDASAGDIVGLTGFEDVFIGETMTDREERAPLPFVDIDPPTIRMQIRSTIAVRRPRWKARHRAPHPGAA